MKKYLKERQEQEHKSLAVGIALTVSVHVLALLFVSFTGLKYLYPPPEEKTVLIEFEEVPEQDPLQAKAGAQPRSEDPKPEENINLVRKSEAQAKGTKANQAKEATVGDKGDVEVPEPPREKEINRRALFHAADNKTDKDTLAPQTSSTPNDKLSEGHASGNTKEGKTTGEPNAHLEGRTVGTLPSPVYTSQVEGIVVIDIVVNMYGDVDNAKIGKGTTISDNATLQAARKAALQSHFSTKADTPQQQGTITYIFKLK